MEHRWGHRREVNRFVRLQMRDGRKGFGRIRDVSISGAWIATQLPAKLLSYVHVGFTARPPIDTPYYEVNTCLRDVSSPPYLFGWLTGRQASDAL